MERFRTRVDLEHFYSHVTKLGLVFNSNHIGNSSLCTTCFNIKGYAFGPFIVLCFLSDKTVSLNDAVIC